MILIIKYQWKSSKRKMTLIVCGVFSLTVGLLIAYWLSPGEYVVPKLPNTWWGPGKENQTVDLSVRPFKVAFDNNVSSILNIYFLFKLPIQTNFRIGFFEVYKLDYILKSLEGMI